MESWSTIYMILLLAMFAAGRDCDPNAPPQCGTLWFYHIPKTGGTTVMQLLRDAEVRSKPGAKYQFPVTTPCFQYMNFMAQYQYMGKVPADERTSLWKSKYQIALAMVRHGISSKTTTLVHHHHGGPGLHEFEPYLQELRKMHEREGCFFKLVTALREPVSHAVSSFYFVRKGAKDPNQDWPAVLTGKGQREAGDYLEVNNYQTRYILNNHRDLDEHMSVGRRVGAVDTNHVCEAARLIKRNVDVVGFTSDLSSFIEEISSLVSLPFKKAGKKNANKHSQQPPSDVKSTLERQLAPDRALYWHLHNGSDSTETLNSLSMPEACLNLGVDIST